MHIDEIAKYIDVSPTYLLRGEEENDDLKLSKEERELILMYRWLNQGPKDNLMTTAEVHINLRRSNTKKRVVNDEIVKKRFSKRRNADV